MKNILIDMEVNAESLARLQDIPDVCVKTVEPSEEFRPLPKEIIHNQNILFCTCPPTNLSDMKSIIK